MIRLEKPVAPVELTEDVKRALISEFKDNGKSVWSKKYIKQPLLAMSSNKCCFCETKVDEESKYMEVEHFHHKGLYKDEVVDWENLLPSCKKCNGSKGPHDTKREPIINPCNDNPKDHLKLWRYRFKGKDLKGKTTISTLNLNDQVRLVKKRFEIGDAVQSKLETFNELTDDVISGIQTSTKRKNRIKNGLKELMQKGLPSNEHSATYATILVTDPEYIELKEKLNTLELWDGEHGNLEVQLNKIILS